MTLVMAWREQTMERVWIASDSRISGNKTAWGVARLTDSGAKILSIPVILRRQLPLAPLGVPILSTNVAFTYAGSSLIALQSYAAVLPLWSHLQTTGPERLPAIQELADHLGKFVTAYCREVSFAHHGYQRCQCAIVGFDSTSGTIEGWIVEPYLDGEIISSIRPMTIGPGEIALLGDGREAAESALATIPDRENGLWHREPLAMIRSHLRKDPSPTVGGGVQIGYTTEHGFQLFWDAQPVAPDSPFADMRFRGFDFSEVSKVGDAFVNLPGLT